MLPVAAFAAHAAQQHIRRRRQAAPGARPLRGLGYDVTTDPALVTALAGLLETAQQKNAEPLQAFRQTYLLAFHHHLEEIAFLP